MDVNYDEGNTTTEETSRATPDTDTTLEEHSTETLDVSKAKQNTTIEKPGTATPDVSKEKRNTKPVQEQKKDQPNLKEQEEATSVSGPADMETE